MGIKIRSISVEVRVSYGPIDGEQNAVDQKLIITETELRIWDGVPSLVGVTAQNITENLLNLLEQNGVDVP